MSTEFTRRKAIQVAGAFAGLPMITAPTLAQTWPTKPIRLVTAVAAGGLVDLLARSYGEYIQNAVGQPVIVDSKSGAGGGLAALEVKRSAADGYTLLFAIGSSLITNKILYKDPKYDSDKDFSLISYFPTGNVPFIVKAETGVKDIKGFVEYARKNPVSIGSPGVGSYSHMTTVELNRNFNLKMEPVHYRGETPMWTDFQTGSTQAVLGTWAGGQLALRSGKGRAIAVSGEKRMKKLPEVPTFLEQGLTSDAFRLTLFICVAAPTGTPENLVNRYSDLFVEAGKTDKVQKLMDDFGIDDAAFGRAAFQKLYDKEAPVWIRLASSLGLTPQ